MVGVCMLAACATTAQYESVLASWVGADVNELIRAWGAPDGRFTMPDGHVVLIYEEQSSYTTPVTVSPGATTAVRTGEAVQTYTSPTTIMGGDTVILGCRTEFETDGPRVLTWRHRGNNCVASKNDRRLRSDATTR
jgi:hypothetical protein